MAIYLDRAGADACINKINKAIGELQAAATAINSAMDELREPWQGDSANSAQERYNSEYKDVLTKKVPETVDNFKKFIDDCMNEIVRVDQTLGH